MWRSRCCVLLLTMSLSSCSAIAPLAKDMLLGGAQKGIEARINAGKAETRGDDSVAQNANTAVSLEVEEDTIETFQGPVGQVINEAGLEMHELLLVILLAGWAIPSPTEMLYGLISAIRRSYRLARGLD